jgi:lipoate-protein ligase A
MPGPTSVPFRLLHTPPRDGASNMALDEALMAHARRNAAVIVRVYGWARPTLSLGRHQAALGLYDPARLTARGVDVVRRPTGGRAVLHWREVTYAVAAPLGALAPEGAALRASYARINRLLLDALTRLGVGARLAEPVGRSPLPDGAPCFEAPAGGELVVPADVERVDAEAPPRRDVAARKLVGSAQWQEDGALLQHGSLLVDDDQSWIGELAARPLPSVPPPATLRGVLGRAPSLDEVAGALFAAVRALEDPHAAPLASDPTLDADVLARRARYRDDAWTWRR